VFKQRKIQQLEERQEHLENRIISLTKERDRLTDSNASLERQNKDLSHRRKIDEEAIAHKVKMREEGIEIQYQKKETKLRGELAENLHKVKDDYQVKSEKQLQDQYKEIRVMYSEVLKRLPDVNVQWNKKEK